MSEIRRLLYSRRSLWTGTALLMALAGTAQAAAQTSSPSAAGAGSATPPVTLLYQNWPNPFPSDGSATTCVWFDLRAQSAVRLDVYDLRGNHVRTIAPRPGTPEVLPAGRYGRASESLNAGCDLRFTWDGIADNGHIVPPGIYLLRLRADHTEAVRKVAFRGR